MGALLGIALALAAGKSLAVIAAGLTVADWIAVGEASVGVAKLDAALAKAVLQHKPRHIQLYQDVDHPGRFAVLCFQGAPSGQAAHICSE